jgi:hypothetical protein
MANKPVGWRNQPARHALAARGVKTKPINPTQRVVLDLMKRSSYNEFDGDRVVRSLNSERELWSAAYMVPEAYPLLPLRDLPDGYHNVSTLYIMGSGVNDDKLFAVAKSWGADEISWLTDQEAAHLMGGAGRGHVLRVWWD